MSYLQFGANAQNTRNTHAEHMYGNSRNWSNILCNMYNNYLRLIDSKKTIYKNGLSTWT